MEASLTKELVIESMNALPEKFSLDVLVERLIFMDKVREGLQQADEGKLISHAEMLEIARTWHK